MNDTPNFKTLDDSGIAGIQKTVDTSEMGDVQTNMIKQMGKIMEEGFELVHSKNKDYNASFVHEGNEQFDELNFYGSRGQAISHVLHQQTGHKRRRYAELMFHGGEDGVGEDVFETALDNAMYWMWKAWAVRYGEQMSLLLDSEMDDVEVTN